MSADGPPVDDLAGASEPPLEAADSGPLFLRMLAAESDEYVTVPDDHVFHWSDEIARQAETGLAETPMSSRRDAVLRRKQDLLTKCYLLEARRVARMWDDRGDPNTAHAFRAFALGNARQLAETRCRSDVVGMRLVAFWFLLMTVLITGVVPRTIEALGGGNVPWRWLPPLLAGGFNIIVGLVVIAIVPGRTASRFAATLVWTLVAVSAVAVGFGGVVLDGLPAAIVVHVGADVLVLVAGGVLAGRARDRAVVQKAFDGDPRTILIFDLAGLVHDAQRGFETERILRAIERVADRNTYTFARAGRGQGTPVRAHALHRARGVEAVLRRHQVVLHDLGERGIDGLIQSLFNGIRAVFADDWASFLVVEPEPANRSLLRRYGPRVGLTVGLLAAAVVLPLVLPGLVTNADQFRATLVITAVFTLIAPDVQKAADAVRSFKGS